MPEKEINLVRKRILKKKEMLKKAEAQGDKSAVELYSTKLSLLKSEERYLESGGRALHVPDDLTTIALILEEKHDLLKHVKRGLAHLPPDDVDSRRFERIKRIVAAQAEYLLAKHTVISENRPIKELSSYIQLASEDGVEIVSSPLEHEAEVAIFRPEKKVKRKREFVLDFRKLSLVVVVVLLLLATYFGAVWRKTPHDRDIIRSYVVGRDHYLRANDYYVEGTFKGSIKEYSTAAAFFKKASQHADLVDKSKSGKMTAYFEAKRNFFEAWENISLKMVESSREFEEGDPPIGAAHALEAVKMAKTAEDYNRIAEDEWSLL